MTPKLKSFIISVLRGATFKWKPRSVAYEKAREKVGEYTTGRDKCRYRCSACGELFLRKDTYVDHIDPVVPLDGYMSGLEFDLNEYAERMFCEASGFQVLCYVCHNLKTKVENDLRRNNKKSSK